MNLINGGAHADSGLNVQEFMIVPMLKDFFAVLAGRRRNFSYAQKNSYL